MAHTAGLKINMPLGVVVRKVPGVTRWARWNWTAVAVLPGAGPTDWQELRREGEAVEYHAATLPLTLWAAETEAYMVNLADQVPSIYVVMRKGPDDRRPLTVVLVTASPYESQDYCDNGDDIVEKVPMTPGLVAWVRNFAMQNHEQEEFIKRRRDRKRVDLVEDGKGDARIPQQSDVFRAPKRVLT